jgi:phage shock protein A
MRQPLVTPEKADTRALIRGSTSNSSTPLGEVLRQASSSSMRSNFRSREKVEDTEATVRGKEEELLEKLDRLIAQDSELSRRLLPTQQEDNKLEALRSEIRLKEQRIQRLEEYFKRKEKEIDEQDEDIQRLQTSIEELEQQIEAARSRLSSSASTSSSSQSQIFSKKSSVRTSSHNFFTLLFWWTFWVVVSLFLLEVILCLAGYSDVIPDFYYSRIDPLLPPPVTARLDSVGLILRRNVSYGFSYLGLDYYFGMVRASIADLTKGLPRGPG